MFGVYVSSFVVVVIEVLAGMLTRPEVYETEAEADATRSRPRPRPKPRLSAMRPRPSATRPRPRPRPNWLTINAQLDDRHSN